MDVSLAPGRRRTRTICALGEPEEREVDRVFDSRRKTFPTNGAKLDSGARQHVIIDVQGYVTAAG